MAIRTQPSRGTYTQAGAARKFGLSRGSISRAVKRGALVLDEDGRLDPEEPVNKKYFRFHQTAVKAGGKQGVGRPIATEDPEEVASGSGNSVEKNRELDAQIKKVKLQKARIEYAEAVKQVIPVEIVSRTLSHIAALLNENFRCFDERFGEELHELAQGSDSREFSQELSRLIEESTTAVVRGVNKELEKMEPKAD